MSRGTHLFVTLGAIAGLLTVALGAFGAHALQARLPAEHLAWWDKAVNYQGLHALALLCCGLLGLQSESRALPLAGWAFVAGIVLFSGSLYLLALTGERWLGAVTPFGGMAFMLGWAALAVSARTRTGHP